MSVIKQGRFIKDGEQEKPKSSSQFKGWHHQDQRTTHRKEILQRYVHGKPSGEFIRAYPEEAAQQFTPEQIRHYGNQY